MDPIKKPSYNINQTVSDFFKDKKLIIVIYFILLLAFPIYTIVLPHYYGNLIDSMKKKEIPKQTLYIIIGLWILVMLMNFFSNYLDAYFKPELQGHIRNNIIDNIVERFKECYKEQEIGDLIAKILKLPTTINDLFHEVKDYIIPLGMMFVFAIGYFSYIDIKLGFITFIGIGIFFFIIYLFLKTCIVHARDADTYSDLVYEQIGEMLENLSNMYASDTTQYEKDRLSEFAKNMTEKSRKTIKCSANFNLLFNAAYLILFFGINCFAFYLFKKGQIKINSFTSVLIISLYIISYLSEVTIEIKDFIVNLGTLSKTQNFLDKLMESECVIRGNRNFIKIDRGDIDVRNVFLSYDNSHLFKGLSVKIGHGEKVAIMGQIGSGKSTFVKMLLKFFKTQSGQIFINGVNIENISPESLRQQIMYIPQNPIMFNRTLYENIVYGLNIDRTYVENLMNQLGVFKIFGDLTLDSAVGKRGERLSGGQKQMVYLLRTILKNSKIVILDEPTSALDKESKEYILQILQKIMQNRTVLIITHDDAVLKYVDRTIVFNKGQIIRDTL